MRLFEFSSNILYHGTTGKFKNGIMKNGLIGEQIFLTRDYNKALEYALLRTNEVMIGDDIMFTTERNNIEVIVVCVDENNLDLRDIKVGVHNYLISYKPIFPENIMKIDSYSYLEASNMAKVNHETF